MSKLDLSFSKGLIQSLESKKPRMGCWFSVNASMLSGKKGIGLVTRMPTKFILPETDGPFITNHNKPYMPWETSVVIKRLADIFSLNESNVNDLMSENLNQILSS